MERSTYIYPPNNYARSDLLFRFRKIDIYIYVVSCVEPFYNNNIPQPQTFHKYLRLPYFAVRTAFR